MRLYTDVVLEELPDFFKTELVHILEKEGEWSDDENDHPTKYGIRELVAKQCGWHGDIRNMSKEDASRCWALHSWYWPRYDLIAQQSYLIAKQVLDTSGPAGTSQATRHLQTMLNDVNDPVSSGGNRYGVDLEVDGLIGWNTSQRLGKYLDHRGVEGEGVMALAANAFQLKHMSLTAAKNPGKRDFIYGWWHRRVYEDTVEIIEYMKTATTIKRHGFTHV